MQTQQRIIIKGMACQRCINTISTELGSLDLDIASINLGEVILRNGKNQVDMKRIKNQLEPFGFSLVEDRNIRIVSGLRELVAEVYSGNFDFPYKFRFSELVERKMQRDYDSLSAIFSTLQNQTLEKYIIQYRIEKVKEMLVYGDKTLADISFSLGFSSVAHLSRQFKSETGLNPSFFRNMRKQKTEKQHIQ